jgi:hypothetical protein
MIPGSGFRYAAVEGNTGWIVSVATASGSVALSRLGLTDASWSVWPLPGRFPELAEHEELAADGLGHLWLSAGDSFIQIDESSRSVTTVPLPSPASDASPGPENPAAGYVFAEAWDQSLKRLIFVRVGDHRVYLLDASTHAITPGPDLPILTTVNSQVAVAQDGTIAINGQTPGAPGFQPIAAVLPPAGATPWTFSGAVGVCGGRKGATSISEAGLITSLSTASQAIGSIGASAGSTRPQLACDTNDNVFTSLVTAGSDAQHQIFEVVRISSSGQRATAKTALTATTVDVPLPGVAAQTAFDAPDIRGLLPDNLGGVWVLDSSGSSADAPPSSYPSIWRPALVRP